MSRRKQKEIKRIKALLINANVDANRIEVLMPTIENVAWMKVKLEEARELVADSSVIVEYDNGGGQSGIRENPALNGYQKLLKTYQQCLKMILDEVPQEIAEKEIKTEQKTVLELVMEKHKAG